MSGTVCGDESTHTYELSPEESVSQAVVSAVSTASGHDRIPIESRAETGAALDPLYSVVDPDALEELFRQSGSAGTEPALRVEFSYEGYRVSVRSDGLVAVEPGTGGGDTVEAESDRGATPGAESD